MSKKEGDTKKKKGNTKKQQQNRRLTLRTLPHECFSSLCFVRLIVCVFYSSDSLLSNIHYQFDLLLRAIKTFVEVFVEYNLFKIQKF